MGRVARGVREKAKLRRVGTQETGDGIEDEHVNPDGQPAAAMVRKIVWLGREFVVIDNGSHRGWPRKGGPPPTRTPAPWTRKEDKLVRTVPVAEVIAQTGRSEHAVMKRRRELGVTRVLRAWTVDDDLAVMRLPTKQAAAQTGRTPAAVTMPRRYLGIRVVGGNAGRLR